MVTNLGERVAPDCGMCRRIPVTPRTGKLLKMQVAI
jgi:hypothetical protein